MSILLEKGYWFEINRIPCGHWSARIQVSEGGLVYRDGFISSSEAYKWIEDIRAREKAAA